MVSLKNQPSVIDEQFSLIGETISKEIKVSNDQEELVPC